MKNIFKSAALLLTTLFAWACTSSNDLDIASAPQSEGLMEFFVSPERAKETLNGFLADLDGNTRSTTRNISDDVAYVYRTHTRSEDGAKQPIFYVFQMEDKQGFALVSTDARTTPVYAITNKGVYNAQTDNLNYQYFMKRAEATYLQEIEDANAAIDAGVTLAPVQTRATTILTVGPLLTTKWGQRAPYNNDCFTITGAEAPAGCVPIAVAQVAAYHRYPITKGPNEPGNYDWNAILAGPTVPNNGSTATVDVADLVHDVGIETRVSYGISGTGGQPNNVLLWFANRWYWNPGVQANYGYLSFPTVRASLDQRLPILMTGYDLNTGVGHCWVVDGYYRTESGSGPWIAISNMLYCNWGWNGSEDGLFGAQTFMPVRNNQQYDFWRDVQMYTGVNK